MFTFSADKSERRTSVLLHAVLSCNLNVSKLEHSGYSSPRPNSSGARVWAASLNKTEAAPYSAPTVGPALSKAGFVRRDFSPVNSNSSCNTSTANKNSNLEANWDRVITTSNSRKARVRAAPNKTSGFVMAGSLPSNNNRDFLNQALELAATQSVEWRAFYLCSTRRV